MKISPAKKSQVKIKGTNKSIYYHKVEGQNMTREQMTEAIKKLTAKIQSKKKYPVEFMVSLRYPELYYSGDFFKHNEEPKLFSYQDYDALQERANPQFYKDFFIYVVPVRSAAGGNSKNNDCLFICLNQAAAGELPIKLAGAFKAFLGLKRNDKVPISMIPKIEEKLKKYAINVTGDHVYTSPRKSNLQIHLKLIDGHYTIDKEKSYIDYLKTFKVSQKSRTPIMIYATCEKICAYDGNEDLELSRLDYYKIKNLLHEKYIYVPYTDEHKAKEKRRSLKECYEEWREIADELHKETNGMIDMTKTGSYQNTACRIFQFYSQSIHPEPINQHEALWLNYATVGSIIFSEEYKGPLNSYDFVGSYASILADQRFYVPIKPGKFEKMEELDKDNITYGIYRCIITSNNDEQSYKVFRFNKYNYYTSIDIKKAFELGYSVELIQDEQPNALKYYRDCILLGSEVFKRTVEYLAKLKKKGVKGAKLILASLWGKLCEVKKKKQVVTDEVEWDKDHSIHRIYPSPDGSTVFQFVKNSDSFKTYYARIKPFVLAFGRKKVSDVIAPIKEHVYKCHTDSVYTSKKIKDTGDELGQLKYNGYCENAEISDKANQKAKGEFK